MGKILEEHLKDRGLFTMNNLSTTFRIPKGRVLQGKNLFYKEKTWATRKRLVLQGKDLGYKEKRQDLTTIKKAPTPPHIKVRIIDPSVAL